MRYFSTPLFGKDQTTEIPDREHPVRDEDKANLARRKLHIVAGGRRNALAMPFPKA